MKLKILIFIGSAFLLKLCNSYNILMASVGGTKSHMNFFTAINNALLQKGHNVTFIANHKTSQKHPNLRKVELDNDSLDKVMETIFTDSKLTFILNLYLEIFPKMCPQYIIRPEVQEVLKDDYDVLMLSFFSADCYLSVAYQKKIPFIYVSPNILMDPYSEKVGVVEFPSVSPGKALPFTHPMAFWQRMTLGVLYLFFTLLNKLIFLGRIDKNCRDYKVCPADMPFIGDFERNSSLSIINAIRTLEQPVKQIPPNVIYAGGIHIRQNRTLPKDLQDWMDGSGEDGVLLFSLGTAVKPSTMKKEHFLIFLNAFKSLKQRVICKWDADIEEEIPPNVLIRSWLPQNDILAHPKMRLFITHGGLFSTQEAVHYEVPVIGIPVFGDQQTNVADIVNEGWGRAVNWDDLTEEKLLREIEFVLNDKRLHQNLQLRSKLMKDKPLPTSDEVAYWVEYVIRYQGAHHLRSPFLDMSWYQIYNLDVWVFVIMAVIIIIALAYFISKFTVIWCIKKLIKLKKD